MMRCDPGKLCIARIFQNTCSPSIHSEGMSDMESCYPILRHVNSFGSQQLAQTYFITTLQRPQRLPQQSLGPITARRRPS